MDYSLAENMAISHPETNPWQKPLPNLTEMPLKDYTLNFKGSVDLKEEEEP